MRLIVAGSRSFDDYTLLEKSILENFSIDNFTTIVSGAARGADQLGETFAKVKGLSIARYPADWGKFGKSAGYRRNETMAKNADALIAFWDGESKGTLHMINLARQYNLKVVVIRFTPAPKLPYNLPKGL